MRSFYRSRLQKFERGITGEVQHEINHVLALLGKIVFETYASF